MWYQHSEFVYLGTLGFPFCYGAQIVGRLSFLALGTGSSLARFRNCSELEQTAKEVLPKRHRPKLGAWCLLRDILYCQGCPVATSSLAFLNRAFQLTVSSEKGEVPGEAVVRGSMDSSLCFFCQQMRRELYYTLEEERSASRQIVSSVGSLLTSIHFTLPSLL